jgi:hypothetical protein
MHDVAAVDARDRRLELELSGNRTRARVHATRTQRYRDSAIAQRNDRFGILGMNDAARAEQRPIDISNENLVGQLAGCASAG